MTCITTKESRLSLPGAYCHGNDLSTTTSTSLVDTYQENGVIDPTHHRPHCDNKLAIISPIFFSPSVSPDSLRTALPGTWVDTSPYQLQENKENEYKHNGILQQQQQQQRQQPYQRHHQQQNGVANSTPSSSAITTESPSSAVLDHVDMNHLRQTIASLRERAEQLEQTDLVVKKSIKIVAKKRLLAERRQYAQWDWCDQPGGGKMEQEKYYHRDGSGSNNSSVPILDDMETDRSDYEDDDDEEEEQQPYDGCGGDWEWID